MARFRIPEQFIGGFDVLASLDSGKLKQLSTIIRNVPVGIGPKSFQKSISSQFEIEQADALARTLYSLGGFLVSDVGSIDNLAEEVVSSYNEVRNEPLSKDGFNLLKDNLINIFNCCGNIKSTFKAINLLSYNDKTYRDGKIITDIRPVFYDDILSNEQSAVIIHQLKIEFVKNKERKDFYISLDTSDLNKLKDQVERALKKEGAIRNNLKDHISFINLDE